MVPQLINYYRPLNEHLALSRDEVSTKKKYTSKYGVLVVLKVLE